MKIVNNKIYIARGETPTYSASIIDRDTGAPLVIDKGLYTEKNGRKVNTMVLEFVVRDSAYARGDNFRMKYTLLIEQDPSFHLFDGTKIIPYSEVSANLDEWQDSVKPKEGFENYLYHRMDKHEDNFYAYYKDGHWTEYSFDFDVTFNYLETSVLEPKTYKYEISLLGLSDETNIVYKKLILDLTDFIVEGSISG